MTGRFDETIELTEEGVRFGSSLGSAISEHLGRLFNGFLHHLRGERESAMGEARLLVDEGTRSRLPFSSGFGHILLGAQRAIVKGEPGGVDEVLTGMDELAMSGGQNGVSVVFVLLAEAQLAVGETESAYATASGGLELAEALEQHFFDCELLRLQAKAVARTQPRQDTTRLLRTAIDRACAADQFGLALRAACDLSDLAPDGGHELIGPLLERIVGGTTTSDHRRASDILSRSTRS